MTAGIAGLVAAWSESRQRRRRSPSLRPITTTPSAGEAVEAAPIAKELGMTAAKGRNEERGPLRSSARRAAILGHGRLNPIACVRAPTADP